MQERQEFIDRYFVFNEGATWTPPKDFRHANGLLEDIRQSMMEQDARIRLEMETRPKEALTHQPGHAISLPSMGGRGYVEEGAPAAAPGARPGATPRRPVRPNPGGTAPRYIERRE